MTLRQFSIVLVLSLVQSYALAMTYLSCPYAPGDEVVESKEGWTIDDIDRPSYLQNYYYAMVENGRDLNGDDKLNLVCGFLMDHRKGYNMMIHDIPLNENKKSMHCSITGYPRKEIARFPGGVSRVSFVCNEYI